jgi:uncharacterized protein (DUF302 family)
LNHVAGDALVCGAHGGVLMSSTFSQTTYGFGIALDLPYAQAIEQTRAALKTEGFGVLTEIDVKATLKEKIDVDVEPYIILGDCNPQLAYRALQAEPEIGLLLPCNVIVYSAGEGKSRVAVMDPNAAMGIVGTNAIAEVASDARERLERALNTLQRQG